VTAAELAALLPEIVMLARAADAAVLKIYGGEFEVRRKSDTSPVTIADEASEAIILAGLQKLTPDIPAISEERMTREGAPDISGGRFWLVDPLDGTREFASRNGEFSVNIALVIDRLPELGVLTAPTRNTMWAASGPNTATVQRGSERPVAIHVRKPPASGITVLASRSHGDPATVAAFLEDYKVAERINVGSALKFGELAEGKGDLYPRFGPTMEWDTAAGHAILNAAGGRVETVSGAPLLYGKPGFKNPDFIARGQV
jgi:3'(2'), 5'-bisphosphate nucleotidase